MMSLSASLQSRAALMARGVGLRPEEEADLEFLRELYVSTRRAEFAASGWPEEQIHAFLCDQFRLQRHHYQRAYHDASFDIVMHGDVPIGRLYLHRGLRDYRVVDISLLPAWRGRGIGSEIMRCIQAEGHTAQRKVSVHVEVFNPARNLYQRLGFCEVENKGIYILMEWRAPEGAATSIS